MCKKREEDIYNITPLHLKKSPWEEENHSYTFLDSASDIYTATKQALNTWGTCSLNYIIQSPQPDQRLNVQIMIESSGINWYVDLKLGLLPRLWLK